MRSPCGYILFILLFFVTDLIPAQSPGIVYKSIYPRPDRAKSEVYDWLWGRHYRSLYFIPIPVPSVSLATWQGGMSVISQPRGVRGLLLENNRKNLFLVKPLGGSSSFLESNFFREIYAKADFKDTYLDEFIGDAYTIINPYTFKVADFLAASSGLSFNPSAIYYIHPQTGGRGVAADSLIQGKLVNLINVPDLNVRANTYSTDEFLDSLRRSKNYMADQDLYIRERIFDMWVGDWNKTTENWNWQSRRSNDSLIFTPVVIDRSHAFTKVDGILFKQVLKMLSLDFIIDYDSLLQKGVKKVNALGYALDVAVAGRSDESAWLRQARFLRERMTDSLIDEAFTLLPVEVRPYETDLIRRNLKLRGDALEAAARQYYRSLQRTPVVAGTDQDDYFLVDRLSPDSTTLRIYDSRSRKQVLERRFSNKETKVLWLYGLAGNDTFRVRGGSREGFPVYWISGGGKDTYELDHKRDIRIYDDQPYPYEYRKIKYHETSFTPWGVYDSDHGISLGTFFTYTMYGFKRAPFTYQHRIGYNYLEGFMYQGVFPDFDGKKRLYLEASVSSPRNFENFFGFGNDTYGYKGEAKSYNRVRLHTYSFSPSFQVDLRKRDMVTLFASFEMYKAGNTGGRFIQTVYPADHPVFRTNYFFGMGATYQVTKQLSSLFPSLGSTWTAGWKMNLRYPHRNFPYGKGNVSWEMRLSDRLTWASSLNGMVLFTNEYEFYQAATIGLRGFRDNRFIGKQSFYQQSDLRLDMGKLKNPFTPLRYGFFAGFDYGRVWFPGAPSRDWHTSYGGGIWLTFLDKYTTKYSWFGSTDSFRFAFELGLGF